MAIKAQPSVNTTFEIAKKQIETHDYSFFMRSKEQEEYNPSNVGGYIESRYRYAYIIQDMASLVTSNEISHFLSDIAYKLRNNLHHNITDEQLKVALQFIKESSKEYKENQYVDLSKTQQQ